MKYFTSFLANFMPEEPSANVKAIKLMFAFSNNLKSLKTSRQSQYVYFNIVINNLEENTQQFETLECKFKKNNLSAFSLEAYNQINHSLTKVLFLRENYIKDEEEVKKILDIFWGEEIEEAKALMDFFSNKAGYSSDMRKELCRKIYPKVSYLDKLNPFDRKCLLGTELSEDQKSLILEYSLKEKDVYGCSILNLFIGTNSSVFYNPRADDSLDNFNYLYEILSTE